jgi:hypothetical protein
MMTKEQIGEIINPQYPNVYAPTTEPTKLIFNDDSFVVGYFESTKQSNVLEKENKYTFIEFGEKSQNYRATNDEKFITIIDGEKLKEVEYPSYSPVLLERLKKLKSISDNKVEINWNEYKAQWIKSVLSLQNTLMYKWLLEYETAGVMSFSLFNVKRIEPFLNEYITSILEISLVENKTLILEPISGVTSIYNGELSFYMQGNVYKKVIIYRKLDENGNDLWVLAKSLDQKQHFIFNKQLLESIITSWLQ